MIREPRIAVVIPAYFEAARIGEVVRRAKAHGVDVLVVDDGPDDATAAAARAAGAEVIRHDVNRGKGVALLDGFQEARTRGYDAVIAMDADGQHNPDEIPRFIEAYRRTGIPVLVGNRMADADDMPPLRYWTNRLMSALLSHIMGQYMPDTQCGFRLFRCDLTPFVATQSTGFAAESEVLLRVAERGIRMDSVRISTIYGDEKSKIHPGRDTLRFLRMLWRFFAARRLGARRRAGNPASRLR